MNSPSEQSENTLLAAALRWKLKRKEPRPVAYQKKDYYEEEKAGKDAELVSRLSPRDFDMKLQRRAAYIDGRKNLQEENLLLVKDYKTTISSRSQHLHLLNQILNEVLRYQAQVHGVRIPGVMWFVCRAVLLGASMTWAEVALLRTASSKGASGGDLETWEVKSNIALLRNTEAGQGLTTLLRLARHSHAPRSELKFRPRCRCSWRSCSLFLIEFYHRWGFLCRLLIGKRLSGAAS